MGRNASDRNSSSKGSASPALVHEYLASHPSVRECLARGLINHSALARAVIEEGGKASLDALIVASRRYQARIRESTLARDRRVLALLKRSRLRLRNRMCVLILDKPREFDRLLVLQREVRRDRGDFRFIEGEDAITLITNDLYLGLVKTRLGSYIKQSVSDVAQITLIFDERIETTPGVVSYVYSLLAANGVNIREEMSCWTDLLLLLDERDAARAMEVLSMLSRAG